MSNSREEIDLREACQQRMLQEQECHKQVQEQYKLLVQHGRHCGKRVVIPTLEDNTLESDESIEPNKKARVKPHQQLKEKTDCGEETESDEN